MTKVSNFVPGGKWPIRDSYLAVVFKAQLITLCFVVFSSPSSSRSQMLALAWVLELKDLGFLKDLVFLFMSKCFAWLCFSVL